MYTIPIYNTSQSEPIPTAVFHKCLRPAECRKVLSEYLVDEPKEGLIDSGVKDSKRKVKVHPVPLSEETEWLYARIADNVARDNQFGYKFEVSGIYGDLQILEYEEGDYYDWHMDLGGGQAAHRKLSVIVQLSDPDDYEGGDVVFKASEVERELPKDQGNICIFPSFILHKVNPVTKGKRYALVTWILNTERFK